MTKGKKTIKVDSDLCVICHAYGQDKRLLKIRCMYAIDELVPELKSNGEFYEGWICKPCRGELLAKMEEWRNERIEYRNIPKDHDGCELETELSRNIPVRVNGAIKMLTEEEFITFPKKKPR